MMASRIQTRRAARNPGPSLRTVELLGLVTVLLTMMALSLGQWASFPETFLRALSLIPVTLFAYHYGKLAGLMLALFYSIAFLVHFGVALLDRGISGLTVELLAFTVFINIFAYIVGDTFESLLRREALEDHAREWARLFSKTSAVDEVLHFIFQETDELLAVECTLLLFRNPLDGQWEMMTPTARRLLPGDLLHTEDTTLAQWLLQRRGPQALNDLDQSPVFWLSENPADVQLRSLLVVPLQLKGETLGVLAFFNKRGGEFSFRDVDRLQEILDKGSRALQQASRYARTDYALTRRVSELLAVQETVRAINATLEPKVILDQALDCILKITGADSGIAGLQRSDMPSVVISRGELSSISIREAFTLAQNYQETMIMTAGQFEFAPERKDAVRLLAPISGGQHLFGGILVAADANVFDQASLPACNNLMAHVAVALENAYLFKAMRREKQQVSLIIQSVADGLLTVDTSRRLLLFNPAAEQMTGWVAEDVLGRYCSEVLGCASDCEKDCPLQRVMETGHPIQEEHRVIRQRLGTKRVIALSAAALVQSEDVPYGAVLLFRDVTQQEELYRLQHEFVAAISHELRAPLTKISMALNMLEQAGAPFDTSLDILRAQNQQLTSFADKILRVSHLEVGKAAVSPHPLPIGRVVEEVTTAWRDTDPSRRLTLHLPAERPWVWGDERATRLILNELMDNAFKYTPAEASITVSVQGRPPANVLISIQDEGPGIAPRHQVKVFEQFYRVDGSDAQSVYGHGLGLYIVKRYVEMMGGEIWLESDKGQGCRFAFTLPLMEEDYERTTAHH